MQLTDEVLDQHTEFDGPKTLLYRRFEQQLTDRRIEQSVFQIKSDNGSGPKNYFMNNEYRIESFFNGRPISIWEMKNKTIFRTCARTLCDFNFDKIVTQRINEIVPADPTKLSCISNLENWGNKLKANAEALRKTLTEAGKLDRLKIVEEILSTFAYDGAQSNF